MPLGTRCCLSDTHLLVYWLQALLGDLVAPDSSWRSLGCWRLHWSRCLLLPTSLHLWSPLRIWHPQSYCLGYPHLSKSLLHSSAAAGRLSKTAPSVVLHNTGTWRAVGRACQRPHLFVIPTTGYSSVQNTSPWCLIYFWSFEPALVSYWEPGRRSEARSVQFPASPKLGRAALIARWIWRSQANRQMRPALRSLDRSAAKCCAAGDLRCALRCETPLLKENLCSFLELSKTKSLTWSP